jgi:4-hydroxy-tetrahydrodipicolinate synthase
MSNPIFTGTGTAIVTPFMDDGNIDFKAFKKLIEYQVQNHIEAIVVCGSTGESATLSNKEKMSLLIAALEYAAGRIKVIAGTGSNNTQSAIDLTLVAKEHGADAVLLVAPYYNKPSQEGLFRHFKAIADLVNIPQILYNVPSRTGINISAETQLRIANECINVVGTKEASGNLEQMAHIIQGAPAHFHLYSGDDALTLPAMSIGAKGVISVISNYAPKEFGDMVRFALKGKFTNAARLHYQLLELMGLNFIESNPAPAKAALNMLGLSGNALRLPLVPVTEDSRLKIQSAMKRAGFSIKRTRNTNK